MEHFLLMYTSHIIIIIIPSFNFQSQSESTREGENMLKFEYLKNEKNILDKKKKIFHKF